MALNNLTGNEVLEVTGSILGKPSGETFTTTTQDIANLAGGTGGGLIHQQFVSSGTTDTVVAVGTFVGWQSADAAPKTQIVPDSTGSLGVIVIADLQGTADLYPITVDKPVINGQNQVYTNGGVLTLLDTAAGYVGY